MKKILLTSVALIALSATSLSASKNNNFCAKGTSDYYKKAEVQNIGTPLGHYKNVSQATVDYLNLLVCKAEGKRK